MAITDYAKHDGLGLAKLVHKKEVKPVELVDAAIERIERHNPALNAIVWTMFERARDMAKKKLPDGPFKGVPFLLKDIMGHMEGVPNREGTRLSPDMPSPITSELVHRYLAAGLIPLGKTNVPEFGLVPTTESKLYGPARNPWNVGHSTGGSSGGSGAAVASGMVPMAHANDGGGSIRIPASACGLVGLKPTLGLIPRSRIVPISHSQDTAGPMTRTVRDAAILLSALIASDPADPATAKALDHAGDYAAALDATAIRGMRIGVIRGGQQSELLAVFAKALDTLRGAGATLVEIKPPSAQGMGAASYQVLLSEFHADLDAYLATTRADQVPSRSLADLIAFNAANAARELPLFGQDIFVAAQAKPGLDDPDYRAAREKSLRLAGAEGIDAMLRDNAVDLVVMISYGPAWPSDTVWGDQYEGPSGSTSAAAIAGYPHLTVPMGTVRGLPVGLSFIGTAYAEQRLLNAGYAFEQAAGLKLQPDFRPTVDAGPDLESQR